MVALSDIPHTLAGRRPKLLPSESGTRAAVALILRQTPSGPEILFIERARHDEDPWSGDLGFPGGKIEANDRGPRAAAERESREEVGLDLEGAQYLGRLDDIAGAHLPVVVSSFVYQFDQAGPAKLSTEVRKAFWFPLAQLIDPVRHIEASVDFRGRKLIRPAIRLLGPGRTVLWGITYRLVIQFLGHLGQHIGPR